MTLDPGEMEPMAILITAIVLAVLVGVAIMMLRRRHSARMRAQYGAEYDREISRNGLHKGEKALRERERRAAAFDIRTLSADQRQRFIEQWRQVQERFVDDPAGSVLRADVLLAEVMETRGYPVSDFEQRAADLSVDHPHVVEHYRTARDIAARSLRNEAGTEELRHAMIHFRALFDDLVNEPSAQAEEHQVTITRLTTPR